MSDYAETSTEGGSKSMVTESQPRTQGTVKWFSNAKGYGFIAVENHADEDVFVHFRAINTEGFRTLHQGQIVEFNLVRGKKGYQAEDVMIHNKTSASVS